MHSPLMRWLVTSSLVGATMIVAPSVVSAQPVVRDHREAPRPLPVSDAGPPREAPPAPKQERVAPRAGFVWQPGRWDWRGRRWEWIDGRWERERPGKRWRD